MSLLDLHDLIDDSKKSLFFPKQERIHTGYGWLDQEIEGYPVGSIAVVAAESNVGKSFFGIHASVQQSIRGVRNAYISCEDTLLEIRRRYKLYPFVIADLIQVSSNPNMPLEQLLRECESAAQIGARCIYVDYIQNVDGDTLKCFTRHHQISQIASRLKSIAVQSEVAIVVMSQVAQHRAMRPGMEIPIEERLKESGDIRNKAEYIVTLQRSVMEDQIIARLAKSKDSKVGRLVTLVRREGGRIEEI